MMHPVYRVKIAAAGREQDGIWAPTIRAVSYVTAPSMRDIPRVVFAAVPAWKGASLEVLDQYDGELPLWPVRIGTGIQRFLCVPSPDRDGVPLALQAFLPEDDPWRPDMEAGWFEVDEAIDRSKEGVR